MVERRGLAFLVCVLVIVASAAGTASGEQAWGSEDDGDVEKSLSTTGSYEIPGEERFDPHVADGFDWCNQFFCELPDQPHECLDRGSCEWLNWGEFSGDWDGGWFASDAEPERNGIARTPELESSDEYSILFFKAFLPDPLCDTDQWVERPATAYAFKLEYKVELDEDAGDLFRIHLRNTPTLCGYTSMAGDTQDDRCVHMTSDTDSWERFHTLKADGCRLLVPGEFTIDIRAVPGDGPRDEPMRASIDNFEVTPVTGEAFDVAG